ncbi:MAG: hypothetical protein AAF434_19675 [Pseudomonadota bacterium]
MADAESFDEDDFPVLTDVAKPGDAELIDAARQAYADVEESTPQKPAPNTPPTPAQISRAITAPPPSTIGTPPFADRGANLPLTESQLEQLIDEIIERHADQMRNELHTILKHRS